MSVPPTSVTDLAARPTTQAFALVEVGTLVVGVPTRAVVQAIPRPQTLTPIPRSKAALEGVFLLRGQAVPLINLQRWMASDSSSELALNQVLVLRADDKLLAIVVSAVKGMLQVNLSDVHQVHHDDDAEEFFHSVAIGDNRESLVTLLDVQRLAVQAQVWSNGAGQSAQGNGQGPSTTSLAHVTETHAVMRSGSVLLGIPGHAVGEVITGTQVKKIFGMSKDFIGMVRWRHKDVPVLDLAHALGAPQVSAQASKWLLVMHTGDDCLAFWADELCAVTTFPRQGIQLSHVAAGGIESFCSGSCRYQEGERVYLVDPQAIFAASPLSRLGAAPSSASSAQGAMLALAHTGQPQGDTAHVALIVFKSKLNWAAPMHAMHHIVKVPSAFKASGTSVGGVVGSIEWKGMTLPLIDLRLTFDTQPSALTDAARVIFVNLGDHMAGLLVEEVLALIPGHTASRSQFVSQGITIDMVTVGTGEQQKSYRIFDLATLVKSAGEGLATVSAIEP